MKGEEEVKTFKDQISSSTAAMAGELRSLEAERSTTAQRADRLRMRREELLAQLKEVEEELSEVEEKDQELDQSASEPKEVLKRS